MSERTFTYKERKFIRELKRTFNATEAAMRAYNCKSRNVGKVVAHEVMKRLKLTMADLMDAVGLDTEEDVSDLARLRKAKKPQVCDIYVQEQNDGSYKINKNMNSFVDVDDNATQLKALELSLKLKGIMKDERTGSNGETKIIVVYPSGFKQENKIEDRTKAVSSSLSSIE